MEMPLYIYFIAISLLTSILSYPKRRTANLYLKVFPFYLCITFIIECVGNYRWSHRLSTATLYSLFGVFEFAFYFFVLHQLIKGKTAKKIVRYVMVGYPILFLINILFVQTAGFHSITYSIGCLIVVSICIYYFFELFQATHSTNLLNEPPFWICTGLLFFYCCTFPYFALSNFLINFPDIIMDNISTLLNLMNCLLYSLFTIAFLCKIRIRKSMSLS
jgi:hypothetical protein